MESYIQNITQNFMLKGLPFIQLHWQLFLGLIIVLGIILVFEKKSKRDSAQSIDPQTVVEWVNRQQACVIDIRDREAFRKGHIIHSESIESANVVSAVTDEKQAAKYRDKPIIVVCAQGISAKKTAAQLKQAGVEKVAVLRGGIQAWISADLPLEKK